MAAIATASKSADTEADAMAPLERLGPVGATVMLALNTQSVCRAKISLSRR